MRDEGKAPLLICEAIHPFCIRGFILESDSQDSLESWDSKFIGCDEV